MKNALPKSTWFLTPRKEPAFLESTGAVFCQHCGLRLMISTIVTLPRKYAVDVSIEPPLNVESVVSCPRCRHEVVMMRRNP